MINIRAATLADSEPIADLTTSLGYPSTPTQIASRLETLQRNGNNVVLVAESGGELVGWIHVFINPRLEDDGYSEIGGLVVDESAHGLGIGRMLVDSGVRWAREHGCTRMRVRSREERNGAHQFYRRIGFEQVKVQKVLDCDLTKRMRKEA